MFRLASFSKKTPTTWTSSWIHFQFHEIGKENWSDHPEKAWFHLCLLPEQHRKTTKTLYTLCSTVKKLLSKFSTQAPAHYCRFHRMATRSEQGSSQPRTQPLTAANAQTRKTKYIIIPAQKISHSPRQVTTPRLPTLEDTPAVPRSCAPTLQIVHPVFQPSTTATFSSTCPYSG